VKHSREPHGADDVKVIIPLISIFQVERFEEKRRASRRLKRHHRGAGQKDLDREHGGRPCSTRSFRSWIQAAIDHRAKRMSDAE